MYDSKKWTEADKLTVKDLIGYLQTNCKPDTTVTVCGSSSVFLHCTSDSSVVTIDSDDLSDLEEYKGKTPKQLKNLKVF